MDFIIQSNTLKIHPSSGFLFKKPFDKGYGLGYDMPMSAKSDIRIGVLKTNGDNTRLIACFLLPKFPFKGGT